MKINSSSNNVNFTSIIPYKVYVNQRTLCSKNPTINSKVGRKLSSILSSDAKQDNKLLDIIKEFSSHDKDYTYSSKGYQNKGAVKHIAEKGEDYILTGIHASELNKIGKELGIARAKKDESQIAFLEKQYANKIKSYVSLVESKRDTLELHINVTTKGSIGDKNFKVLLGSVFFEKVQEPVLAVPNNYTPSYVPKTIDFAAIKKNNIATRIGTQLSLLF